VVVGDGLVAEIEGTACVCVCGWACERQGVTRGSWGLMVVGEEVEQR
jgi:hypothetical protein